METLVLLCENDSAADKSQQQTLVTVGTADDVAGLCQLRDKLNESLSVLIAKDQDVYCRFVVRDSKNVEVEL